MAQEKTVLESVLKADCIFADGELQALPITSDADGLQVQFDAPAGPYQFSAVAAAREFDWDELYFHLRPHRFE